MRLEKISDLKEILEYIKEQSTTFGNLIITVVSPFVQDEFVTTLFQLVPPHQILIVTDKRNELYIEEIAKSFPMIETRLAECHNGIVHTKLFLLDWEKGDKILLWGSANATLAGFNKNAESISWCKIPTNVENGQKILSYFKLLWQNAPVEIKSHIADLGVIQLLLPSFHMIKQQDSFDRWLEEGKLFDPDKYKTTLPDSVKTVRLKIHLKKDIKTKELANLRGLDYSEQKTLSYNKFEDVPNVDLPSIKDYAVNTTYGYWIPNQVIVWFGNSQPKSKIREAIESKVGELIKYIETNREELIKIFMEHLIAFAKDKQAEGSLTEYFKSEYLLDDNKLKIGFIEDDLNMQLDRHIEECKTIQDQTLEIHDLFPIRFYLTQWDKFALSFVKFISLSGSKKTGLSKIFIDRTQVKDVKQGKTKSSEGQLSLVPGIAIDWDKQSKDFKQMLEQLRNKDWSAYRKSIHEDMEKELSKKLDLLL